jgi:hypothetical protein
MASGPSTQTPKAPKMNADIAAGAISGLSTAP